MTHRERVRAARVHAVRQQSGPLAGVYARQNRQEFAASRAAAGWSPALVAKAVSAGPLACVRAAMEAAVPRSFPKALEAATHALGIIDAGRPVECGHARYGDDASPLQRRTYAPSRLREI